MDLVGVARAVFDEIWNRCDFVNAQSLLADPFRFHIGGMTRAMTIPELEEIVGDWHAGFSDLAFDVHAVVASDDRAAVHATLCGTHDGEWGGLAATGRAVRVQHMFFFRFESERIVEVWELLDRGELQRQLTDT